VGSGNDPASMRAWRNFATSDFIGSFASRTFAGAFSPSATWTLVSPAPMHGLPAGRTQYSLIAALHHAVPGSVSPSRFMRATTCGSSFANVMVTIFTFVSSAPPR
jgi:hypothetical protein